MSRNPTLCEALALLSAKQTSAEDTMMILEAARRLAACDCGEAIKSDPSPLETEYDALRGAVLRIVAASDEDDFGRFTAECDKAEELIDAHDSRVAPLAESERLPSDRVCTCGSDSTPGPFHMSVCPSYTPSAAIPSEDAK